MLYIIIMLTAKESLQERVVRRCEEPMSGTDLALPQDEWLYGTDVLLERHHDNDSDGNMLASVSLHVCTRY